MENKFQLSELRKRTDLDPDHKKILNLIDSTPFKFFMDFILKDKDFSMKSDGSMILDGKPYSNFMIGKDQFKKLSENDIQGVTIKDKKITINTGKNESFIVILD